MILVSLAFWETSHLSLYSPGDEYKFISEEDLTDFSALGLAFFFN